MSKAALFPVLLALGCVAAGLYGAIHDQISYTASPDYFHAFKFYQFNIPTPLQNRLGAAIVGWEATWWMGLLIGLPLLTIGLILPDARTYAARCLIAFGAVTATALIVGLGALALATATIRTEADVPVRLMPPGVADPVAFARVGMMHNFSYLGGFLGIVTGGLYLIRARIRLARQAGR